MQNCYIYETLNPVTSMSQHRSSDGLMHLQGTFGVCGVKNNNSRIYEAGNYSKMVAMMQERLKSKPILGELEHPQSMNITLENVSHKITSIQIDENGVVSGEIVLLNTPKGKIAQAIVEGGAPLFISSRAQGSINQSTGVVTLENLATYDLVGSPGFSQAELHLNEGQVAEAICESCGYVYTPSEEQVKENVNNDNMESPKTNNDILEKLDLLEQQVNALKESNSDLQNQVESLNDENEDLREKIYEYQKSFDMKSLCDSIQKWIIEEYSPEVQNWIVEEFAPEVQNYIVEEFAPEVQKWILEEYSPEVQNWCQNEFADGIQKWIVEEYSSEVQNWIMEHYSEEVKSKINEAVDSSKKNSLSNIEKTLTMLEGIDVKKPTYRNNTLITEANAPKYIAEMPAIARVKYDLASSDIKESIDRRARLFDFSKHTINEFWEGIDFDRIKPSTQINEGIKAVTDSREASIRARLSAWSARRR